MMFVTHLDEKYIKQILLHKTEMMGSGVNDPTAGVKRDSKICWIRDEVICKNVFGFIKHEFERRRSQLKWAPNVVDIESIQYSEYHKNDRYDWHRDIGRDLLSNNLIRKISFSIIVDSEFKGGEFDIETEGPSHKKRYYTFNPEPSVYGNTIIFYSYMWHRVRPIKSGIRKSLVGWLSGPA